MPVRYLPELSVEKIWPEAMKMATFKDYMPDEWNMERIKKVDRSFFYGVLAALNTNYVVKLQQDVLNQRALRKIKKQFKP
jgi:hypothetical protein